MVKLPPFSLADYELRQRDVTNLVAVVIYLLLVILVNQLPDEFTSQFPTQWDIHLSEAIDQFQSWVIANRAASPLFIYFFDPLSDFIDQSIRTLETFLIELPWSVFFAAVVLLGQRLGGLRLSLLSAVGLLFIGMVGLWDASMQTLALMGVSVVIALVLGIPLGILSARYDKFETALKPILDAMQVMPAFVYLIPVLLLFGVGRAPSVVATVIYALPPAIRLTSLGIRQVPAVTIEAARAFGSTRQQILFKVQIPMAMPAIIVGINQTIMMALSIVVIAALIGAGGLGREVLVSLQRLQVGQALEAGLAIVFMAIILDRVSHAASTISTLRLTKERFRFFPARWGRFELIWLMERGLAKIYSGVGWAAKTLAVWLSRPVSWLLNKIGATHVAETTPLMFQTYSFELSALLFLALLLFLSQYFPGLQEFPAGWTLSLRQPTDAAVAWARDNLYQIGGTPIGTGPLSDFMTIYLLNTLRSLLQERLNWLVVILTFGLLGFLSSGWRLGLFSMLGMFFIGLLGMWVPAMDTLSQVIIAVIITLVIAIPLGVLSARSDTFAAILRPILDTLQTIPPFVYLVPVIMLFNVGRVPGIIASVLYSLPPGIRLTNLGIRGVSAQTVEVARAFGSTSRQTLRRVQMPLAMPSIMLGVNQTVMMVFSMIIIAGLVGGGGLGLEVVIGLAKNQTGRGVEAGIAIVIMAIIIDRITQGWAKRQTF
jgi:glycine betaine/proline transport system permease protein